ncbi:amidohydrolase [Anaerosacchariphilus polymeriproducens]|uniref:Amidohydrolase n=1 Tax=Anaerosacchariphilus polymeriproducens TaxID=1812858 RepID=A0A371AWY1_9FIRM|nr:amidohydrolase family protein [Anaerosacchariphilus polymeriproducens]RDU24049.1 amidohydrolase [Anaerosacchariphilus polymeriproducens]
MKYEKADIVLISNNIFTGRDDSPIKGYIVIQGNKIKKVGTGNQYQEYVQEDTQVINVGDRLITAGFADVHTFFTGYAIYHIGVDFSGIETISQFIEHLEKNVKAKENHATIFGHGWNHQKAKLDGLEKLLNQEYPDRGIIVFAADRSTCIMNKKAREQYLFTPDECYPEAYYRIMKEYLNDASFIEKEWKDYMFLLNSKGVTSVKEMGFDDFYGFDDFLKQKEEKEELNLRVHFMSQPVGEGMNIQHGKKMREKFRGDFVRFSGYNRMTDGTISSMQGDLLEPYENTNINCSIEIDYDLLTKEVLEADKNDFRFSLHAQGDGAVRKALDIYDKCKKIDGKLVNRHAITDMEFSNPIDLKRMGQLGAIGEIYFQIMSLDPAEIVKSNIDRTIGRVRSQYYWNRRGMIDSGVVLSGATDLPLMIPDIPEAVYHSCGGYFPEGGEAFNKNNTIELSELLKAFTIGGQINLGMEDKLGTLEEGKLADIAVLEKNLFEVAMEEIRDVNVVLTIVDGKVVYDNLKNGGNEL